LRKKKKEIKRQIELVPLSFLPDGILLSEKKGKGGSGKRETAYELCIETDLKLNYKKGRKGNC